MFGTPDIGHSDIWHFNFSLKYLLGTALHQGYLPLWSKDLGTGFPLLGEGQVGMLNFINLILFRLFDPVTAFNLGFATIFLTTASGSYFFGRVIKLSRLTSIFLAIVFSLSGAIVTHVTHYNLIQAGAYLPWEFFLMEKYFSDNKKRWLLIFSFVLAQQVYSGFQQAVMISMVGVTIFVLLRMKNWRNYFWIAICSLLGFTVSSPQLLASWELAKNSFRSGVSIAEMSRFPLVPKHLLTFFSPYLLGDPRIGTYPPYGKDWGIFWESTGYIGIIPLLVLIRSLLSKKQPLQIIFLIILGFSFILMMGKYTPLFFVFQIPPFSLFRVPARFIFLFDWAAVVLAGIYLDRMKSAWLRRVLVTVSVVDICFFAFTYNTWINDPHDWLKPPETVKILSGDNSWFRIYGLMPAREWNEIYFTKGGKDISLYKPFRNSLDANQNIFWNISSIDYYTGMASRRQELWKDIYADGKGIVWNKQSQKIWISPASGKVLSLAGVKYITSPNVIEEDGGMGLRLLATTSGVSHFYIYQNPLAKPHAYFADNLVRANSISDLMEKLTSATDSATVVEEDIPIPNGGNPGQATIVVNKDLEVMIETETTQKSFLVLSDSYYPGWKATVDSKTTKIYPANLNERGVVVPAGRHTVRLSYQPWESLLH